MNRVIVCLSGGKASAWCADWALRTFAKDRVILYFNDTKWEHPDLYRFLDDLEKFFDHPITVDADGRDPEQVFRDQFFLGNNRVPICSRILKAERLQAFYEDGDDLVFGIGPGEMHRAKRIVSVYQGVATKTGKFCRLKFPLIQEKVSNDDIDAFLVRAGIDQPLLYKLGFLHNNCSGGCVRMGKKAWVHLLKTLPEVYADRERLEDDMSSELGKEVTFLKDESLWELRIRAECGDFGPMPEDEDDGETECIGICESQN